jgi:hypothetical protein
VNGEEHTFSFDKTRFIYQEKGSSFFLSEGSWTSTSTEIFLTTDPSSMPDSGKVIGDIKWVDLTGKRLKIVRKNILSFDGASYFRRKAK